MISNNKQMVHVEGCNSYDATQPKKTQKNSMYNFNCFYAIQTGNFGTLPVIRA